MDQAFQFFKFVPYKDSIYGYPLNPWPMFVSRGGEQRLNPIWNEFFEGLELKMTFEAIDPNIKPGIYDRDDIKLVVFGYFEGYAFKEFDIFKHLESHV